MNKMKKLKNKFTFMLRDSMCGLIYFKIALFFFSNSYLINSQTFYKQFENPKSTFMRSTAHLPHVISTNGEQGFSFVYSYPGYFSYFGQSNLYYTNSSGNSFFAGIGMGAEYLMSGMNINILDFEYSKLMFNLNVGLTYYKYQLGSLGLSYLMKNRKGIEQIEFSFDIYFHHGANNNVVFQIDAPYLRGIMTNIHFQTQLTQNLSLNYEIGFSFVQYRYMKTSYDEYYYVTKYQENMDIKNHYGIDPTWESKLLIPFGIALSYHF